MLPIQRRHFIIAEFLMRQSGAARRWMRITAGHTYVRFDETCRSSSPSVQPLFLTSAIDRLIAASAQMAWRHELLLE
jgi:hypothetical protein